jgi:hypothetical protein
MAPAKQIVDNGPDSKAWWRHQQNMLPMPHPGRNDSAHGRALPLLKGSVAWTQRVDRSRVVVTSHSQL